MIVTLKGRSSRKTVLATLAPIFLMLTAVKENVSWKSVIMSNKFFRSMDIASLAQRDRILIPIKGAV